MLPDTPCAWEDGTIDASVNSSLRRRRREKRITAKSTINKIFVTAHRWEWVLATLRCCKWRNFVQEAPARRKERWCTFREKMGVSGEKQCPRWVGDCVCLWVLWENWRTCTARVGMLVEMLNVGLFGEVSKFMNRLSQLMIILGPIVFSFSVSWLVKLRWVLKNMFLIDNCATMQLTLCNPW